VMGSLPKVNSCKPRDLPPPQKGPPNPPPPPPNPPRPPRPPPPPPPPPPSCALVRLAIAHRRMVPRKIFLQSFMCLASLVAIDSPHPRSVCHRVKNDVDPHRIRLFFGKRVKELLVESFALPAVAQIRVSAFDDHHAPLVVEDRPVVRF